LINPGKALFQPDPCQYSFEIVIVNTDLVSYTETGDWQFNLTGLLVGQTNLTIDIKHSDVTDYSTPNIDVTINPAYTCGDVNDDESVNVSDAVSIINFVFVGGNPPDPMESGDCNCDGSVNVSDAVYIINFVFNGGNNPCDTNGDEIPDC